MVAKKKKMVLSKFLALKNVGSEKNIGSKKYFGSGKNLGLKKILGVRKILVAKKMLVQKICLGLQKNLVNTTCVLQINFIIPSSKWSTHVHVSGDGRKNDVNPSGYTFWDIALSAWSKKFLSKNTTVPNQRKALST